MHNNISCKKKAVFSRCLKPFQKQDSHKVQENANGCCLVQKKISLTGFAKIAKSKGCLRMAIKLLVFFLCTSGFFYQVGSFLQMYLVYPTALDTSEENPDSFMEPAVTVCNRNRLLRQPYCKTLPEECTWQYTTWESFCDRYRRMCPENEPPDFNFGIPVPKHINQQNQSNALLKAAGPQDDSNFIHLCQRIGHSCHMPINSSITAIQVHLSMLPYKCFSLFSLLSKPDKEPTNLSVTDGYIVQLHMHPEEHFDTIQSVQASVVFHDPRKAVNPLTEGITLTTGNVYHLFPTMERIESLPPPYSSNCMDYLKEWKKNGGFGPLSKDDCIDQCKMKTMLDEYGCIGHTLSYPSTFPICVNSSHYVSNEDNRRCTSSCRDACEETIYHVTSDTIWDYDGLCNATDEYCKSQYMYIKISFNRMKIKKFKQIPRIESIELFSYIGGYLGMWLGISLAAVYDVGEMIYDVIDSAFRKEKKEEGKEEGVGEKE